MVKKYKVIYNDSNYETSFETRGKNFQDFKAIFPNAKVTITNVVESFVVKIKYLTLVRH